MRIPARRLTALASAGGLALGLFLVASPSVAAAGWFTCSGTPTSPGVLSGTHASVQVVGACFVNSGAAVVRGDLVVRPGGVLVAAFALDSTGKSAGSNLTVTGDLTVQNGATLLLGCEAAHFSCIDDPNQTSPTLNSHDRVNGSLIATGALGVVVHTTWIGGNVAQSGGGGGFNCTPTGVFSIFGSPVYSDYEDVSVEGSLSVRGLTSCWLGVIRTNVEGSVSVVNDQLADPDAIEIELNHIGGNLSCSRNSMVWDSADAVFNQTFPRTPGPNFVDGHRSGQCVLSSPTTQGGPPGPGAF